MFSRSLSTAPTMTATSTTDRQDPDRPVQPLGERRAARPQQHADRDRHEHDREDLQHLVELQADRGRRRPGSSPADRFTTTGSVTTASTELTAVRVTLSATWPPNRWL